MKKENILVVALIVVTAGAVFLYNASKSPDRFQGNGSSGSTAIAWQPYQEGLSNARDQGKHVFLYFHAQWCTYCTKLKKYTFPDTRVAALLGEHFISIGVDTDKNGKIGQEWQVKGLPTMWFLKPDGSRISSLPGYVDADQMTRILEYISTGKYETMSFHEFAAKS